jgi:hypothetical protein
MTFSEGVWFWYFGLISISWSKVGFAGFPCLGDLNEDAGDEPQE